MRWEHYIESTQVYPMNPRTLRVKEVLEDDYIHAMRKKLDGDIILIGNDYEFIKTLELNHRYDKFTYEIKDNGVLNSAYEFTIEDCDVDDYKHTVKIKVTPRDIYTEIQENEDVVVNVIGDKTEVTIETYSYFYFYVQLQYTTTPADTTYAKALLNGVSMITFGSYCAALMVTERVILHEDTPAPSGWHLLTTIDEYNIYERYPVNFTATYTIDWTSATDDSDYRWSGMLFYRPPYDETTHNYFKTPFWTSLFAHNWSDFWIKKSAYDLRANVALTQTYNAMELRSVLTRILTYACPNFTGSVKSSLLFKDDPESGFVIPDSYTDLWTDYHSKYLIEMSEFKKPNATEDATKGELTLKNILEYLCDKHKSRWHIDSDGNLRIEHVSYYKTEDVTLDKSTDLNMTTKYSYLQNNRKNREYMEESQTWNTDFSTIEVVYGSIPALNGVKEDTKKISLSNLYTDVDGLNTHLDDITGDGFVYIDVDSGACSKGTGFKSGRTLLQNVSLSNANCLNRYYRYDAPQPEYSIGGIDVNAETLEPLKKQDIEFESMLIPNTKKVMVSRIGTGKFKELAYPLVDEYKFKAELLYE